MHTASASSTSSIGILNSRSYFSLFSCFCCSKFFFCSCFDSFVVLVVILQSRYPFATFSIFNFLLRSFVRSLVLFYLAKEYLFAISVFSCSMPLIADYYSFFFFSFTLRFESNENTCSLRSIYLLRIVHLCTPKSIQSNHIETNTPHQWEKKKQHSFHLNGSLNKI